MSPSGGAANDYLSLKVPGKGAPLQPPHVSTLEPPMDIDARFQASFYISFNQGGEKNQFCSMPTESSLSPSSVPEPPVNQMSPWMSKGAFGPQIQSSRNIKIAIQDHSKVYLGVNSHPNNGLRFFKSNLSSCCGAPAEETLHFQSHSFMHTFIHISYSPQ